MVCKKCGCETLIEDGDWLECTKCGAKYFNTEIKTDLSATEKIDKIENKIANGEIENKIDNKKQNDGNGKKEPSKLKSTIDFLLPIVIAVVIALLLKTFVFANARIPTGSMTSTINAGDRVIASRLAYINDDPERYDIIIFRFPDNEKEPYVKRIIGMPGETVTITDGVAYITDKDGNTYQTDQSFLTYDKPRGDFGPYYIPEKGEIITQDDKGNCFAENGMQVGENEFTQKYCVKDDKGNYIVEENLYFCMGDNRNNSADSRYWNNKYVAQSKIIGKAKFKYYPKFEKLQ